MADRIVYTDDPDASWTFTVRSKDDTEIDWSGPLVAIGPAGYVVSGTWETAAGTTRVLRVPLVGLTAGTHRLYLKVPGGADRPMGTVTALVRK